MLELPPKSKYPYDRFINHKNNHLPVIFDQSLSLQKMDIEEKTPYQMLISGQIFQN